MGAVVAAIYRPILREAAARGKANRQVDGFTLLDRG